jgi:multimeric flavodoxin WrbA
MNILVISASPRGEGSETFKLAEALVKDLPAKVKTEIIHLSKCRIDFCRACERCHKKVMECPIKDDAPDIVEKMLKADGIVLVSPNYINQVTASMKALFDRSTHFIHCKRLLGNYVAGLVSSGSGNDSAVLDFMKYYANICGAQYVGGVSCRAPVTDDKKKDAAELGRVLFEAIEKKTEFADQMAFIETGRQYFRKLVEMRKDQWSGEYEYWKNIG